MNPAAASEDLFVYGTLRRGAGGSAHATWLGVGAEYVDAAVFQGVMYLVDAYPGVVPSPRRADRVRGEVYRLRHPGVLLRQLDAYEGCGPESPRPTEFVRQRRRVRLASGGRLEVWIYLYHRPVTGLVRVDSGDFLEAAGGVHRKD